MVRPGADLVRDSGGHLDMFQNTDVRQACKVGRPCRDQMPTVPRRRSGEASSWPAGWTFLDNKSRLTRITSMFRLASPTSPHTRSPDCPCRGATHQAGRGRWGTSASKTLHFQYLHTVGSYTLLVLRRHRGSGVRKDFPTAENWARRSPRAREHRQKADLHVVSSRASPLCWVPVVRRCCMWVLPSRPKVAES